MELLMLNTLVIIDVNLCCLDIYSFLLCFSIVLILKQVFNNSIRRRLFDRLLYIIDSQNWEAMGTHYWLKQCMEVKKQWQSNKGIYCLTRALFHKSIVSQVYCFTSVLTKVDAYINKKSTHETKWWKEGGRVGGFQVNLK